MAARRLASTCSAEPDDLLVVPRLVPGMGLEQAAVDVSDGGAGYVFVEAPGEVGDREQSQHAAESLDRPDPGQGADGRLRGTVSDQELGLLDRGEVLGPGVERHIEYRRRELLLPLLLPGPDGRPPVPGAGGHVLASFVEATVAPDTAGDERLHDVVVGQQLALAELGLHRRHRRPFIWLRSRMRSPPRRPAPVQLCSGLSDTAECR